MNDEGTILIVDDEASARDTLEAFLLPEGHALAFARDGAEALQMASELKPDLVLLDVMMPDLDGFEVCARLRADPALDAMHIVMLTALDDRDSRLRGLEVGADDFISKPFDGAELQVRVRTVMQLNRYRRLLAERTRFEWVVEQARDGYVMLDNAGRVVYTNPQARRYLGDPDVGAQPVDFLAWVGRQYRLEPQEAWSGWPPSVGQEGVPRYIVRPESLVTSALWLQVDITAVSGGGAARYLVQLRDVTEEILTRNRVWTFDAQISHKVKTPLGQLVGTLQLLDLDVDDLSREEIKADVSEAYQSAQRLKDRILDVFRYLEALDLSRTEQPPCRASDVAGLVAKIGAALHLESVAFSAEGLVDPDVRLALSRSAVELILWELFENAQKFHPEGTPALDVSLETLPAGLRLRVQDDGRHLPTDELDKIWLPYYQVEGLFTGEVPGMGLGLAVVSSLVWGVGGTCRAYNREGREGVTVALVLPALKTKGDV